MTTRFSAAIALSILLLCSACQDHAHLGAGGLVVEAEPIRVQPADRDANPDRNEGRRDVDGAQDGDEPRQAGRNGWGRNRSFPSDTVDWGDDREMPGDQLPSQRQVTGRDREMPSDSMPSRTGKWGKDREMPSDSPNWGKGRQMPSDTAFRSRSDDDSDSGSTPERAPADDSGSDFSDE